MDIKTHNTIQKILSQAQTGSIRIGDKENEMWTFFINFHTKIQGILDSEISVDAPVINIPNYELFVKKVSSYLQVAKEFYKKDKNYFGLSDESFSEKLFLDLMVSTTACEHNNIYDYIDMRMKMLEYELPQDRFLIGSLQDKFIAVSSISKLASNLEAPYKYQTEFIGENDDSFKLPNVVFGIVGDEVRVYAIQAKKAKQTSPVAKTLDRYFRKVNKDVDPESIEANVSPNALVALTIFASWARQNGYKKIVSPDFLPIRYESNRLSDLAKAIDGNVEEALEGNDRDQFNMTNKLMYVMLRYTSHFGESVAEYDDVQGLMNLTLKESKKRDDNIIYDIDAMVDVFNYKKQEISKILKAQKEQ